MEELVTLISIVGAMAGILAGAFLFAGIMGLFSEVNRRLAPPPGEITEVDQQDVVVGMMDLVLVLMDQVPVFWVVKVGVNLWNSFKSEQQRQKWIAEHDTKKHVLREVWEDVPSVSASFREAGWLGGAAGLVLLIVLLVT